MSNTPVLVDEAMSVISAGPHAGEEHLRRAEELLRPVGKVLRIPESQQDAAAALSGSGPAYVYFLVEAMVDAGILLGMPRGTALEMVTQAVFGAATMLRESGEHPVIPREAVTSPGGTTISAVRELERHGVRAAFLAAIEAARDPGGELRRRRAAAAPRPAPRTAPGVSVAGGLHHAMRGMASGFCVYNDPAIAIRWLLGQGAERIAYVDVDVHHGDGVEAAFWDDPRVLTISLHEHPMTLFPGTGVPDDNGGPGAEGMAVNVALPAGTGGAGRLRAVAAVGAPLLRAFRPPAPVTP